MAKAQLKLKMASIVVDNKTGILKYLNKERRTNKNGDPLLDKVGHLTNSYDDKEEIFQTFFHLFFDIEGVLDLWSLVWRTTAGRLISSQMTLNLYGICCFY